MDATDDNALVELWFEKYDSKADQKGLTASKKKSYVRLTEKLKKLASDADVILAQEERGRRARRRPEASIRRRM